jgi:hypothetical protein
VVPIGTLGAEVTGRTRAMSFAGLNHLAVVLAAVASFIFGGLWYGMLAKQWMAAANVRPEDIRVQKGGATVIPYVIAFVAQLVMAFVLAGTLGHLGVGQVTLRNGLITGAIVWAGFVATSLAVNHAFQGAKKELTLIDGGHWLGVLLIQGAVIGWMGVS